MRKLSGSNIATRFAGFLVGCLTFLQLAAFIPAFEGSEDQASVMTASANPARGPVQVCKDFKNIAVVYINMDAKKGNCDSFRFFDEIITSMQPLSSDPLQLGYLQIDPRVGNNYGSEEFDISKVTVSYDEYGIDWNRATKIVFIHEIGHLILDSFLAKEIPVLKMRSRILLQGRTIPVKSRLQQFKLTYDHELTKLAHIRAGYDELFADLVQALVLGHPAINNQAARLFGIPTESCRTFNEDLPAGFRAENADCRLSAIRYQLWNDFVAPNLNNKKMVLTKLAKAIQHEVILQMRTNAFTPAEQGERLLQAVVPKKP